MYTYSFWQTSRLGNKNNFVDALPKLYTVLYNYMTRKYINIYVEILVIVCIITRLPFSDIGNRLYIPWYIP